MTTCELCGDAAGVKPYQIGGVHGRLCAECTDGAAIAIAAYGLRRVRECKARKLTYFVRGHVADALRYDGGNSHEFTAWLGHGVMVSESDNGIMMLENATQKAFTVRAGEIVLRESDGSLVTITSIPR